MAEKETGWREIDNHPVYLGNWPKFHGYGGGGGAATKIVSKAKAAAASKSAPLLSPAKKAVAKAVDNALSEGLGTKGVKAPAPTPASQAVIDKHFLPATVNRGISRGMENKVPPPIAAAEQKYISETHEDWAERVYSSLSAEEVDAVGYYTASGYATMNKVLWKDPRIVPGSNQDHLMKAIDKAGATKEDLTLYRNMGSFPDDMIPKVGETATMAGFLSTAVSPQPGFVRDGGTAFEIHVPKGSKGLLGGMNPAEREWIVKHGAQLKYLGAKTGVKYGQYTNTTHFFLYEG